MEDYNSVKAGKLLLALANSKGIVLNVTKVQKILYIIYGYFLAKQGKRIFDESPKAWPYGPVFPKTRENIDYTKIYRLDDEELKDTSFEDGVVEVFGRVIDKYSKFTASQLSDWSHMQDGPWSQTRKLPHFKWNQTIPDKFIREYFSNIEVI